MANKQATSRAEDPHNLQRFLTAQADSYARALAEIQRGRKQSHWMWWIFPQLAGLGMSATSRKYSIQSLEEARAYLAHPVLGPRLVACAQAILDIEGRCAWEILGSPDDMKLRSCATLFASVSPAESVFHRVLQKYYGGHPDTATLRLAGSAGSTDQGAPSNSHPFSNASRSKGLSR